MTATAITSKEDLVSAAAAVTGMTKQDTARTFDAILAAVVDSLRQQKQVRLHGVGTLKAAITPAHTARNPRSGEPVQVGDRRRVTYTPSAELKNI